MIGKAPQCRGSFFRSCLGEPSRFSEPGTELLVSEHKIKIKKSGSRVTPRSTGHQLVLLIASRGRRATLQRVLPPSEAAAGRSWKRAVGTGGRPRRRSAAGRALRT